MKQKLLKLFSSSTSKDTLAAMVGNAGVALGGMLFTIIAARSLSPDKFGLFSSLLALYTLLASLGELGIPAALVNFLPKFKNDRHVLISLTFWFQLLTSFIFALIVVLLSLSKNIVIPGATYFQLFIVAFLVFGGVMEGFTQAVLRAERHFILASSLWIVDSLTKLLLLFALFTQNKVTIESSLIVTGISITVATLIALSREFKNIHLVFPKNQFKEIYLFSRWIALTRVFSVTVSRIDILILNSLAGNYQAGIFAAASRITLVFTIVVSSLGNVVAPRFSSFNSQEQIKSYLKKLLLLVTAVSVGMALCIFLAKPIILLVFGTDYQEAILVFQLLTLAMIPFLYSIVTVNPIIYSYNRPNFIALTTFVQTVIIITLDVILIPVYGAIAPCIALAVSNFVVLIFTGWQLRRLLV